MLVDYEHVQTGSHQACYLQVTVLALPDAVASNDVSYHNLDTVGDALIRKGIGVRIARDPDFQRGFGEDSAWQELQVSGAVHRICLTSVYGRNAISTMRGPC